MKANRSIIFILISSLSLLTVLIIQANWILQAAQYKKESFDEKANIILARTTEALCADKQTCKRLENGVKINEIKKIDSLITLYMNYYNFHEKYSFEIVKTFPFSMSNINGSYGTAKNSPKQPCYSKSLDEHRQNRGWELKLIFPNRQQFIIKEMGIPFVVSFVLLIVVFFLFWRTYISLTREKRISEHTSDFLNNMTHELKTPLANIALAGRMIMKEAEAKHEQEIEENSIIILEENEKLRVQVEQALSITALENGEIPMQMEELDIHQLINNSLKAIRLWVESKQGDLKLQLNATQTIIMGDQIHLSNALQNLLDNAIKYSNGKPQLTISTYNSEKQISIIISDTGIGIEKKYQKKVFDKFFRIPQGDVHNARGFGLGLAYVNKIVELHKGRIMLESEKGKGTSIKIIFPNE